MIDDYIDLVVAVLAVVAVAVLAFVIDVAAAESDVVISADVAVVVFILLEVAAVASDFEIDNGDFDVAWYFLEIFAEYFGDLDDVVESAVYRLHLRVLVDLAVFL